MTIQHDRFPLERSQVTGLILAGGQGSRMGHLDKGLQTFGGKPMVQHALERLAPQVGSILISANRNLGAYAALGHAVLPDTFDGYPGPLAGLHAGLARCPTPYLATVPCDSPFLPADLVARLFDGLRSQQAQAAVAVTGDAISPHSQPVFCLLEATVLPQLSAYLEAGGRRVGAWQASLRLARVHFDDEMAFRNINTFDELKRLQAF